MITKCPACKKETTFSVFQRADQWVRFHVNEDTGELEDPSPTDQEWTDEFQIMCDSCDEVIAEGNGISHIGKLDIDWNTPPHGKVKVIPPTPSELLKGEQDANT